MTPLQSRMIDAALPNVVFDGWSPETFRRATEESGATPAQARAAFPRGAIDLALAFHRRGDAAMVERLGEADLPALRFRDRIARAVRIRLEIAGEHEEAVRRGVTLMSLPIHAADGTRALWGTADAIWTALGDTSRDVNWYTKRATLAGVYSATLLYWLGDKSEDRRQSWGFLDRRIDDVMQIEKVKARVRDNPVLSRLMAGPNLILGRIRAPGRGSPKDMPGYYRDPD
ncbi:COQ9 family protein [uncultured Jannaschia sp.]|uniref:COQ9 family protein n=1 Tax=uncultured Jannaschia sp. TaxID=293347 RepID=UPI00262A17C6|nr:COQ9 family protein [uncultured Jannaschia sp.]